MMDMMNDGQGWWMMGGMWILSLILWILAIAGAVLIVRWIIHRDKNPASGDGSPLDILKERYARGEIDRETFEQLKRDIGDNR